MQIEKIEFGESLEVILNDLKVQLELNHIDYLKDIKDGPANVMCTCPFHKNGQERKPSFGINKDTGIGHCFTCGEVKTLPEVISFCFGYRDSGAYGWDWLLRNYLTIAVEDRKDIKLDLSRDTIQHKTSQQYVSEEELASYRYVHPYLEKRGIVDDDIIDTFDLGYDFDTDSITFPIRDVEGRCLFVARRNVKTKFFNYPSGVKKPLYGLYELSELAKIHHGQWENEVLVCESMIDCILLWQYGHYAVALNGLGNDLQMQQLRDLPCRKLILATDNDEAGYRARLRLRENIKNKFLSEIQFPDGVKDIGECNRAEIKHILDWEVI